MCHTSARITDIQRWRQVHRAGGSQLQSPRRRGRGPAERSLAAGGSWPVLQGFIVRCHNGQCPNGPEARPPRLTFPFVQGFQARRQLQRRGNASQFLTSSAPEATARPGGAWSSDRTDEHCSMAARIGVEPMNLDLSSSAFRYATAPCTVLWEHADPHATPRTWGKVGCRRSGGPDRRRTA